MSPEPTAPLQLADFDPVSRFADALGGSCLDPQVPPVEGDPAELIARNSTLFTIGGSWPRDVWVTSGAGGSLKTTRLDTGETMSLVDLCTILTVLGVNDPWVQLKQLAFLVSRKPHHVTIRLGCDLYYRVARRLLACFNDGSGPDDYVLNMRQCNGSDAVELALHSAWNAASVSPGRTKLGSFRGSYHGESLTASLVSEHQPQHGSGRLLVEAASNVSFFPSPAGADDGQLSAEALATLSELDRDGADYFAVIIEPVQWRNSVQAVPLKFLRRLREICSRHSICLIFDEIHNGFGYTGTISFAQSSGVHPDIAALSKGLTSGHGSLAITVARRSFSQVDGTFAGKSNASDMLTLIAIDAVLDRLVGVSPEEAAALPAWLSQELSAELKTGLLATRYDETVALLEGLFGQLRSSFPTRIGKVTGAGLVRGLVMLDEYGEPSDAVAADLARRGLAEGVYVRQAGTALFFKPSLVVTQAEINIAHAAFTRLLTEADPDDS